MIPGDTVLVTGASGNLGQRLLPLLHEYRVLAVDMREPEFAPPECTFVKLDMGTEGACDELIEVMRRNNVRAVVHLAFVIDPLRTGVLDLDRQWQINVAGTARVMEAIAEVNRLTGSEVGQFIYPSSVSAYGPELPRMVSEDHPLEAHTLPYAVHKREADQTVQRRSASLGRCSTYLLRPHIFTGASMQNYLVGALRGTPTGKGSLADKMRAQGKRLPLLIPSGETAMQARFQFVHVDDVARLIAWILRRNVKDPPLTVLNVAGAGEPITIERCAEIGKARIVRLPKALCTAALRLLWKAGISGVPPEAFPYMVGTYTMNLARLKAFLGPDWNQVMRYSVEDALRATFADETAPQSSAATPGTGD